MRIAGQDGRPKQVWICCGTQEALPRDAATTVLQADLRGKLARRDDSEDLLTSLVLGTLAYLPAECGVVSLLARARDSSANLLDVRLDPSTVDWFFWPTIPGGGGQPDVVVAARSIDGSRRTIIIEAKYYAEKSSREIEAADGDEEDDTAASALPKDQLAKYCAGITQRGMRLALRSLAPTEVGDVDLIFLTAHGVVPTSELTESQDALARANPSGTPTRLYWLSWRDCAAVLGDAHKQLSGGMKNLARDAEEALARRGFRAFRGWRIDAALPYRLLGLRIRYGATRSGWFAQDLRREAALLQRRYHGRRQ